VERSGDSSDWLVKFIHSKGPSPFLHQLQKGRVCWVEMKSILKVILPQTAGTGHQYILHEKLKKNVSELLKK
jgi:hypothetical protein